MLSFSALALTMLTTAAASEAAAPQTDDLSVRVDRVASGHYATQPQIVNVEGMVTSNRPGRVSLLVFTRADEGGNLFLQQNDRGARTQLVDPRRDGHFSIPIWLGKCAENAEHYRVYVVLFPQLNLQQQRVIVAQASDKTDQIEEVREILEDSRINLRPLKIAWERYHRVDPKGSSCPEASRASENGK